MAKETPAENNERYQVDETRKKSARRWFEQGAKLLNQRNYDFAVKSFVEGLEFNPLAVEEGWVPLRGCAMVRVHSGGKKPGKLESMKYSMTTKDPVKGMLNAAWLFGHNPMNIDYAEGILRNANKARCEEVMFWAGPIYRELLGSDKKPNPKKFGLLKDLYEELGDRCQFRGEVSDAIKAYELGLEAINSQRNIDQKNRDLDSVIKNLSTKLTIVKGKYDSADSFRDSVRDGEEQSHLQDEERLVHGGDALTGAIERARKDMEANPDVDAKVIAYVDLLCKIEDDESERKAIVLLTEKYRATDNYRFKMRADDIAIKQLGRQVRRAKKSGDEEKVREVVTRQLRFEEKAFRERAEKYPTDLRFKYEHARRLFRFRKYDDAIPLFQQARNDPKARNSCSVYLGRCFLEKNLPEQSIEILNAAVEKYELSDDDVAKELNYWLGRSLEAAERKDEARKTYGKLMQIDYNYRDIRDRMENL